MRQTLLFILFYCLFASAFGQKDIHARIKTGLTLGYVESFQSNTNMISPTAKYLARYFSGIDIGGYFKYQKRGFIIEGGFGYLPTRSIIKYTHPHSSAISGKDVAVLHTFRHQYTLGAIINRKSDHSVELGAGLYFHNDINNIKKGKIHYTQAYDYKIGEMNNMPAIYLNRNIYNNYRYGLTFHAQYNNTSLKYPLFIRLTWRLLPNIR